MKDNKIYVCEHGNIYEGGHAFYATTNYSQAILAVDAMRSKTDMHQKGKNYWSDGFFYIRILVFND